MSFSSSLPVILRNSLTCMTSRLRRVCHRDRGSRVRVIRSPPSCEGVEYTSGGSSTVSTFKASRAVDEGAYKLMIRAINCMIAYLRLLLYPEWRAKQRPRDSPRQ